MKIIKEEMNWKFWRNASPREFMALVKPVFPNKTMDDYNALRKSFDTDSSFHVERLLKLSIAKGHAKFSQKEIDSAIELWKQKVFGD